MTAPSGLAQMPRPANRFEVRDFLRKKGVSVSSPDRQLSADDILMQGSFLHAELRPGLFVHCSDAIEERAFTATSELQAGLSCIFFIDGEVDLQIGERSFAFIGQQRCAMTGVAIMNTRTESFQRSSHSRQYLRHVVVSASPEWLDIDGLQGVAATGSGRHFLKDHLSDRRWQMTPRTLELVRQILSPPPLTQPLHNLYLEGRAVEIVAESLAAAMNADRPAPANMLLTRQDRIRLQRALDVVEANLEASLSVQMIARQAGISASGLQRLFQAAEGKSIFEYVRERRLGHAFELLARGEASIQEAASAACYTSQANFATAFRKRFGKTPREVGRTSGRIGKGEDLGRTG